MLGDLFQKKCALECTLGDPFQKKRALLGKNVRLATFFEPRN